MTDHEPSAGGDESTLSPKTVRELAAYHEAADKLRGAPHTPARVARTALLKVVVDDVPAEGHNITEASMAADGTCWVHLPDEDHRDGLEVDRDLLVADDLHANLKRIVANLHHKAEMSNNDRSASALAYAATLLDELIEDPDPEIPLPPGVTNDYYGGVYRSLVRGGSDPDFAEDVVGGLRKARS